MDINMKNEVCEADRALGNVDALLDWITEYISESAELCKEDPAKMLLLRSEYASSYAVMMKEYLDKARAILQKVMV